MDTIARRPAAYLFPDGAAVFTDDLGRPIHDLQALNWRGLHEFLRLYPDAEVCLRGESCLTGDCLLSFLSNIALPEMAGVEDEKEGG